MTLQHTFIINLFSKLEDFYCTSTSTFKVLINLSLICTRWRKNNTSSNLYKVCRPKTNTMYHMHTFGSTWPYMIYCLQ